MIAFELDCGGFAVFPEEETEATAVECGLTLEDDFWYMKASTEAAVVKEIGLDRRINSANAEQARREAANAAAKSM